jgi:hypothetical protein
MRGLVERWRDGFDWRAQEAKLNAFDQFTVAIDGIDITGDGEGDVRSCLGPT